MRNLLDRLDWNLAVIVSADKATSFTVPKIVIFGDVVLVFKSGPESPDDYYANIQTLFINTLFTHLRNITQKTSLYAYYAEFLYFYAYLCNKVNYAVLLRGVRTPSGVLRNSACFGRISA